MSASALIEYCMTKESLQSITLEDLAALAREEGYEEEGPADRAILIEFILENRKDRAREKERENSPSVRVEDSKYQIADDESRRPADLELLPIPHRYSQSKIVFMVRDPHWAFAYWELDERAREGISDDDESLQLVLRVHETGVAQRSSFDIPVQFHDCSWYIYLPNQDCSYLLELGTLRDRQYTCVIRSNSIRTPREDLSRRPAYAMDWHCAFSGTYGTGGSDSIPQRILAVGTE
jgi:hypothetical protein